MKLALNSLQTYQILAKDDQMLILCLSYFITTVMSNEQGGKAFFSIYKIRLKT